MVNFPNESYGGPSPAPWKVQIHQLDLTTGRAILDGSGAPMVLSYFQSTFPYKSLWCHAAGAVLMILDKNSISAPDQCLRSALFSPLRDGSYSNC